MPAWEQRKLGELFSYGGSGGTPSSSNDSFYGGKIPFLGISDVKGRDISHTAKHITENGLAASAAWVVPSGAVCLAMYASVGKVGIIRQNTATSQAFFNMVFDNDGTRDFVYSRLERAELTTEWESLISTGTQRNLNANKVRDFMLAVPAETEQRLIGSLFARLDSLITLHQRKYDKLCTVKKSMLDKMFPKPGETEPEIRFAGFTDPWEQRKFSDLTDRVSIQSSDSDLPQVEYEDIVSGEGTLNKDLHDKEGGKTGIKFYAGDVLYGKLRPYLMNWLYPQFNGVAVGDFWVLRATECDSSFLYRLVQTDSFQRLANVSTGSKMPRADWNLISQSFFAVPADYAEQKAIAKSLAELDGLITLHQRKLDLLKNMKKSLLDKMFV